MLHPAPIYKVLHSSYLGILSDKTSLQSFFFLQIVFFCFPHFSKNFCVIASS